MDNVLLDTTANSELEGILIQSIDKELGAICGNITDLVMDMDNGVRLIYLVSCLNDFFIPLSNYYTVPANDTEKTKNIELAFKLMGEVGIPMIGIQPLHVLMRDKKKIIRIL